MHDNSPLIEARIERFVKERLTPALTYRQALRYRSASHYGDGNPLAVIDSAVWRWVMADGTADASQPVTMPPMRSTWSSTGMLSG